MIHEYLFENPQLASTSFWEHLNKVLTISELSFAKNFDKQI